jgi:cytochrome c oxidase assembly factor CtaG
VPLALYLLGLVRVWRAAGYGRGIRPFEAAAFGFGWLTIAIAVSPPLDDWSEKSLAAHMVQHELLMVIAAPLMASGAPVVALLWAMNARSRRALTGMVHRPVAAVVWRTVTAPPSVFLLYALALWVWHVPALYDYALEHEAVHVVQHLCFFGAATLFWWGIVHGRYGRLGYGAAVVYVFATAVHGGVLGALMTVSPRAWYAPYAAQHAIGLTALEDQQLAGLLMWVPAGLVFAAGALLLFAAWLRQSERLSRFKDAAVLRPTGTR